MPTVSTATATVQISWTFGQSNAPLGIWTKTGTKISNTANYLAENMVFDSVSGKYYLVFTKLVPGGTTGAVGIASSANTMGPWTIDNDQLISIGDNSGSPCLQNFSGTWYLYYGKGTLGSDANANIYVATASAPEGPYTLNESNPLISPVASTWEANSTYECYVFLDDDGKYVMFYMGNSSGAATEQVGLATANSPTGPFTKSPNNPVLPFGPPGNFDSTLVSDPFVYKVDGVYYVFHTCSGAPNGVQPWQIAYRTSTDLINFSRNGVVLPVGSAGSFDSSAAFRGAISLFGNTFYLPYTANDGSNYYMTMATLPVGSINISGVKVN